MNSELILYLAQRAIQTALLLAAPVLIVTLVLGLVVAMGQAVTSVRDMTFGLILKLGGVGVTILLCGGWMIQTAVAFTNEIFDHVQMLTR